MIALGGRGGTANAGSVAESSAGAGPIDYSGATNSSDATYYNDAAFPAADPYVLHDKPSGYYYAYSTDGARPGADGTPFAFGIYRSADLVTWERLPGGALPLNEPNRWGRDWFWAPEVYLNEQTGKYFLFYSARQRDNVQRDFGYADFEEPSKVGVAVSDSPAGPFRTLTDSPLDYFPYDPDYHDVNLIMDAAQRKPPATLAEGQTASLGTYIPFIDPNVFFDDDGRIYLYFSRNAYRNWVWDSDFGKYIEESNIYAVELTRDWWDDPAGQTKPTITDVYRDANRRPGAPAGARRDGYVPILSYAADKQAWENAHVNDYAKTGGANKDRRWAEGSSTFRRVIGSGSRRRVVYYLTYSANNFANEFYGVGYATAPSPLGPWRKFDGNPILSQDPALPEFSTGHGSLAFSPDGRQAYYVHHGRPTTTSSRRLYTDRLLLAGNGNDAAGVPILAIDAATGDRPVPSGAAPYRVTTDAGRVSVPVGATATVTVTVRSAAGARLALANPLNRLRFSIDKPQQASIEPVGADQVRVSPLRTGTALVRAYYQRRLASGEYVDVHSGGEPVGTQIVVATRPAR
ncbi:family 43 glycosylhydrolase [Nakamurella sp. DB0629]|uniref:Family 43 glycosylhydrolase n=2 Tax=Nakamurella aerolata TaxID=1656892 RepID=A0A849AAL1_9ACTN|nr:family 43 glycosylhydrolase [Nakamurella aerolata]